MEPKLLTEAQWRNVLAYNADIALAYIGEQGLIAPEPVDPLLIEAREIVACWYLEDPSGQYQQEAEEALAGEEDGNWESTGLALAALRRGMELQREAQPALTVDWLNRCIAKHVRGYVSYDPDALHAALTQPPHAGKGVGHG